MWVYTDKQRDRQRERDRERASVGYFNVGSGVVLWHIHFGTRLFRINHCSAVAAISVRNILFTCANTINCRRDAFPVHTFAHNDCEIIKYQSPGFGSNAVYLCSCVFRMCICVWQCFTDNHNTTRFHIIYERLPGKQHCRYIRAISCCAIESTQNSKLNISLPVCWGFGPSVGRCKLALFPYVSMCASVSLISTYTQRKRRMHGERDREKEKPRHR